MAQISANTRAKRAVESSRVSTKKTERQPHLYRLLWAVAVAGWVFVFLSLASFDPADPPGKSVAPIHNLESIHNLGRQVGAIVSFHIFSMLGSGAWLLLITAAVYLGRVAFVGPVKQVVIRGLGVLMLALAWSGFHALLFPSWSSLPEGGGGLVAIAAVNELILRFGHIGAAMWLAIGGIVGATVAFDHYVVVVPREAFKRAMIAMGFAARGARVVGGGISRLREGMPGGPIMPRRNDVDDDRKLRFAGLGILPEKKKKVQETIDPNAGGLGGGGEFDPDEETPAPVAKTKTVKPAPVAQEDEAEEAEDVEGQEHDAAPAEFDPDALREKIARLPVRFANANKASATQEDLENLRALRKSEEESERNYLFPGLDLLENPEQNYSNEMESYVREQAEALEAALHQYGIDGEVVGIESGPVITLYQVRLAPGTKVSSLQTVASDVARSLKAVNVRLVPNTEGLDTVGVEVPNRKKEKVRIKELMTASANTAKMRLPMFLGKDASGNPLIVDLASLPHLLIAGTTGSGKSVCMNAIIMGFLYTQKPSDLKMVLVDPKMVELSQFKDIPHLMCPVVTEMGKAAAILEWAVTKMDERYELLAEAGCRDIAAYNGLGWDELKSRFNPQTELEEAKIPRKLPYMVFIIDELADLMMTNKEVEGAIVRIAQKARAVGIHLILATQRPQANVVTGLIKSNMPGRLAFKVASGMDSRIVMDQKGAELLLGQGDMLMLTPRSSTAIRAQATLVDDQETRRVVRFVKEHSAPSFERTLVQLRNNGMTPAGTGNVPPGVNGNYNTAAPEDAEAKALAAAQEDALFDKAVEIVIETRRGSVSLLQRRLAIGYTRASRLIELMGIVGIIGEHKGSVAREVQMSIEEWEAIKKLAAQDAEAAGQPSLFGAGRAETAADAPEPRPRPTATAEAKPAPAEFRPAKVNPIEEPPFDVDDDEPVAPAVVAPPVQSRVAVAPTVAPVIAAATAAAALAKAAPAPAPAKATKPVVESRREAEPEEAEELEDAADDEAEIEAEVEIEEDPEIEAEVEEDTAEIEDDDAEIEELTDEVEDAEEEEEDSTEAADDADESEAEDETEEVEATADEEEESDEDQSVEDSEEDDSEEGSDEEYEYEYVEVDEDEVQPDDEIVEELPPKAPHPSAGSKPAKG